MKLKHQLFVMSLVGVVLLLTLTAFTFLPSVRQQDGAPVDVLGGLPGQLTALAGIAALVPVLVSFGKIFGLVKDGTSQNWTVGANLLITAGIFVLQLLGKTNLLPVIDAQAGYGAQILTAILVYLGQVGVSRLSYAGLRGSFLAYSFSVSKLNRPLDEQYFTTLR